MDGPHAQSPRQMSEKQKMISGEAYLPSDPELSQVGLRASAVRSTVVHCRLLITVRSVQFELGIERVAWVGSGGIVCRVLWRALS